MSKEKLRQQIAAVLDGLEPDFRVSSSQAAREILQHQPVWQNAKSILLFAPMEGELDVWPLVTVALGSGRAVALPRFDRVTRAYAAFGIVDPHRDVQTGYYGIREPSSHCEPMPLNRLDLVLVPGVAFDLHGRRLGRGKGYYDRMLANVRGATCGVGFDEQLVDEVPVEPHDVYLNWILTPTRWACCPRAVLE
jgi:5-formyltetrahydrofolate cyclo-ligase